MQDIVDVLKTLPHAVTPAPAGAEVVAADVARGHRALIRQRRRRIARSSVVVAAVAAAMVGAAQLTQVGSPRPPAADGSSATTQQASRVQLVDFTGTQPVGFKVSTVPADWRVISSDKTAFVVAPPGSDASVGGPPAAGPQGGAAEGSGVSFAGRIAVMLQGASRLPSDSPVTKVSINGKDGLLGHARDGQAPGTKLRPSTDAAMGAVWLIFPDAAGNKVLVQVPTSLGLTNDQIVRFAQGITVTSDAHSLGG